MRPGKITFGRRARGLAGSALAVLLWPVGAVAQDAPLLSDFDGDGFDELVIAIPGRTVDGVAAAGAVIVVPGSREGIDPFAASILLHRGVGAIPGDPTGGEQWGAVFETADFNNDGFHDLAIGSPGATLDGEAGRGDVVIFFGSSRGLRIDVVQHLVPAPDLGAAAFGASLQVGLFSGDPFADLAVGAPGAFDGAGAVLVYESDVLGRLTGPVVLRAGAGDEGGFAGLGFGSALAAGAFTGGAGGGDELAIAVASGDAGIPGRIYFARLDGTPPTLGIGIGDFVSLALESDVVSGGGLTAPQLVAGDFDADGRDGLAVGLPEADVLDEGETVGRGGAIALFDGAIAEPFPATPEVWLQSQSGFQMTIDADDEYGGVLAVGDFNGDGFEDLAIGVPLEDDIGLDDRGLVHVLYGTAEGFVTTNRVSFHFDLEYIGFRTMFGDLGDSSANDMFGAALGVGDFNGDGRHDLAIGIPGKVGPDGEADVGWVLVLNGGQQGATTAFARLVAYRTLTGLDLAPGAGDRMGVTLGGGAADCWRGSLCRRLRMPE